MARPREFDTQTALDNAKDVFWELGYDAASLPDLLAGMDLTRGSLYKAFKDKKTLFLLVMDQYDRHEIELAIDILTDPAQPDGWERIMTLFSSIANAVKNGDRRGCLLCSTAAGPARDDVEIGQKTNAGLQRMQDAMRIALDGSRDVSHLLLTQYVGLRILARSDVPADTINASIAELDLLRQRHKMV